MNTITINESDFFNVLHRFCPAGENSIFSLDEYRKNKKLLYMDFGSKLIISKHVEITPSYDEEVQAYTKFLSTLEGMVPNHLFDFLVWNGLEGFIKNFVREEYKVEDIKVPKNMKLTRAMALFYSGPLAKGIQDQYSRVA
jgi:hypothetical protein